MPLVSIIIPVFNVETYLRSCLCSVVNQTYRNIEIIAIDDGSTDNSLKILKELEREIAFLRIISIPHSGINQARKIGVENAVGEWIVFVDADDFVSEKMYECLYNKAEEMDAEIVSCGYMIYQNGKETPCLNTVSAKLNQEEALQDILENKLLGMSVWNKLFRRHVLNGVLFEEKYKINEDR